MLGRKQAYFILAALCLVIYYNSLNGLFVSDDIQGIVENPQIGNPLLVWDQPANLFYSLNYLLANFNPFLYHLTNLILHFLNTVLVFIFLGLFFGQEASLIGASLFAVHPVHCEAISWISGRPYLFTTLFIFLPYFLYLRSTASQKQTKQSRLFYYFCAFAVFSYYLYGNYSFYVFFPFFLLLSDFVFRRWRRNWKWWLPFFVTLALRLLLVKGIIAGRVAFVAKDLSTQGSVNWSNPFFNLVYSFFSHLKLLFWPAALTLYHEPPVISAFMLTVEIILFTLIVAALPFLFFRAREIFFGLGIFILFLAPTYSPVMVSWLVAERYLYFPSVLLSIIFAFGYERISKVKRSKAIGLYIFSCLIAFYAARAVARNEDWKTPARLWRATVEVSPNSPRSHNNMGDVYAKEGNTAASIAEFKRSIELNPNYADAYHNLANMYHHAGDPRLAVENYLKAISFNPNLLESRYNLGIIYLNQNKLDEAIGEFQQVLQLRPDDVNSRTALNFALSKKK